MNRCPCAEQGRTAVALGIADEINEVCGTTKVSKEFHIYAVLWM